jgi:hypothetical protein
LSACENRENNGVSTTTVPGINDALLLAHDRGALLSEVGLPWARAGQRLSAVDYLSFPTRFSAAETAPPALR